jgi:hypothetical protein
MFENILALAAIIAMISVFIFYFIAKKKEGKDRIYAIYFVVVLFFGIILYSYALFYYQENNAVIITPLVLLKGLSLALKTFGGDFNNSVFAKLANENYVFAAAFAIHFLAAFFLTVLFIIKLFGKNVINAVRVFFISWGKKYIVIGCDGQAEIFLKNFDRGQRRRTTVIIQLNQTAKKNNLMNKGYAVVTVNNDETAKDNMYKTLKDALRKAGVMRCKNKTRVISMSEHDEINLLVAKIIADYIGGFTKPQEENEQITLKAGQEAKISKIQLDARIMYSFLERAEHFAFTEKALGMIRFFNPYEIRARKFIWENPITKLIPSHWINTEKARLKNHNENGEKTYKAGNIFVGFGLTNKAILKSSISNNQLLGVDYNALVLSDNALKQEMRFRNNAIGLFDELENNAIIKRGAEIKPNPKGKGNAKAKAYLESPPERNNIVFKEADVLSVNFYNLVIKEIKGIPVQDGKPAIPQYDYVTVIIALGDDRLSIETALELRQKLYEADLLNNRDGNNIYPRVKIFVKISDITIFADDQILNNPENNIDNRIEVFGRDAEILTEEYIINEKLDVLARNIANRYEGNVETETMANEWNTCSQFQRESNRCAAMAVKIKLNLLGFDLKEETKPDNGYNDLFRARYGINTAFDIRAERKKQEKAIELARKNEKENNGIPENILSLKLKDEIIDLAARSDGDFSDTPRNNLARLEHQRWNTFYLSNGWTKLPKGKIGIGRLGRQNEAAKQHACITTFHGLVELREAQKEAEKDSMEKNKEKQYIEAESLLKTDTIRHDFNTMDFLLDLTDENLLKLREAEKNPNKKYTGILTGSGFNICSF